MESNALYCVKLFDKRYYEGMGFQVGIDILRDHPYWANEWVVVYQVNYRALIEAQYAFWDYLYQEKITLEEAKTICPHILI